MQFDKEQNLLFKKREERTDQIRKEKRDEIFKKKRKIEQEDQKQNQNIFEEKKDEILLEMNYEQIKDREENLEHLEGNPFKEQIIQLLKKKYDMKIDLLELLVKLKNSLEMNNKEEKQVLEEIESTIHIRKLMSLEEQCPIQELIDSNGVGVLLRLMINSKESQIKLECAWTLTNVVCGTSSQTKVVIQQRGIEAFIQLLHDRYPRINEQAVWALGNIASDSFVFRDMILEMNVIPIITNLVFSYASMPLCSSLVHHCIWTLSNLCRGRPIPNYHYTKHATQVFCWAIINIKNYEVLSNSAWALSYLSDGDNSRIQNIIDTGVVPFLSQYLNNSSISVSVPMMRVIGNLMTGTDSQTDIVLGCGVLKQLFNLLQTDNPAIRREIMWNISNIAAGTVNQIQSIFQDQQQIQKIKNILETDVDEVIEETLFLIKNTIIKGSQNQIYIIYQNKFMHSLVLLLKTNSVIILKLNLEIIRQLLNYGCNILSTNQSNLFLEQFNLFQGVQLLENLQKHPSDDIYNLVSQIINEFFEAEEYNDQF